MQETDAHPRADRLEAFARSMIGVRFRPQGRDESGCDCVGLALQAAWAAGLAIDLPALPLRGLALADGVRLLEGVGCRRLPAAEAGDLLVQAPAVLQLHIALKVAGGLVEAHAGLRWVVLRPMYPGERWHSAWRLPLGDS